FLIATMGLEVPWSFGLACLDIHALIFKKDLHNHIVLCLVVIGDWRLSNFCVSFKEQRDENYEE
ncbi:hypothetical protein R6Q57_011084, partial [Mikania cordata]